MIIFIIYDTNVVTNITYCSYKMLHKCHIKEQFNNKILKYNGSEMQYYIYRFSRAKLK